MAASYFDVDGTLVRSNLMHTAIYYMANDINPLHSMRNIAGLVMRAPRLIAAELRDRRQFNELLFEIFKGTPEDRLLALADDTFEWAMKQHIYEGARDIIRREKENGHKVVLVSGALDFLLERLSAYLGADEYMGNHLEINDGLCTGKLGRPVVAGPSKSRIIADHARANGYDLAECAGYSDSYSDVPMLSIVGKPAALNPDTKLRRLAKAYGWPVIDLS
jgi:HAD superfamily hydrolase (TIGR01490 family)